MQGVPIPWLGRAVPIHLHGLKIPSEATQVQGASFLFVSSPSLSYSHPHRTVAAAFLGKFGQTNPTFFVCFFCFLPSLGTVLSAGQIHVEGSPPAPSPAAVHPDHDGILHRAVARLRPQAPPHRRAGRLCTGSPGGLLRGECAKWAGAALESSCGKSRAFARQQSSAQGVPCASWGCGGRHCAPKAWSSSGHWGNTQSRESVSHSTRSFGFSSCSQFHQELSRESGVLRIMALPHTTHPNYPDPGWWLMDFQQKNKKAPEKVANKSFWAGSCATCSPKGDLTAQPCNSK